jgi:HEAT repeat protein
VDQEKIKKLISSFADHEPPFTSLGTPLLADTGATRGLVEMGQAAVPELIEGLSSDNPKIAMYAAYCLGQIGDQSALPALRRGKETYMAHEAKAQYDFGVISAMAQAEEKLSTESGT